MSRRKRTNPDLAMLRRAKRLALGIVVHIRDAEKAARAGDTPTHREAVNLSTRAARRLCVEAERELNGFIP